jgi:uncharacterized protein (DUF697 family)
MEEDKLTGFYKSERCYVREIYDKIQHENGATGFSDTGKVAITELGKKTLQDYGRSKRKSRRDFLIKSIAVPIVVSVITAAVTAALTSTLTLMLKDWLSKILQKI